MAFAVSVFSFGLRVSDGVDFVMEKGEFPAINERITTPSPFNESPVFGKYMDTKAISPGILNVSCDIPADESGCVEFDLGRSPVEICFCLEGEASVIYDDGSSHEIKGMNTYIAHTPNCSGKLYKERGIPFRCVSICLDPSVLSLYLQSHDVNIKERFEGLFKGGSEKFFFERLVMSQLMVASSVSVLSCIYEQAFKELFLTSKSSELLFYAVMEFVEGDVASGKSVLQPWEVNNVIMARDILMESIIEPPTITKLAKMIGLNEFKLKAGFKEIFGATIHNYIKHQRITRAKTMLDSADYNVSEVAWDIGYTNVSHFIAAFKKQYGISPGQYLRTVKQRVLPAKMLVVKT